MGYSSQQGERDSNCASNGQPLEVMMPSSNFASAARRQHSGRITENSDNWLRAGGETSKPGPHVITNSENHNPSKGKKTGLTKDVGNVKRRLNMDSSQPEPVRSHRRNVFPVYTQQPSQKSQQVRLFTPRTQPPAGTSEAEVAATRALMRTSEAMAASLAPESIVVPGEIAQPEERKVLVGNGLVDLMSSGRRTAPACIRLAECGSLSQKALSVVSIRDQHNSDTMREQLKSPAEGGNKQQVPGSTVQPVTIATPIVQNLDQRVHSFGEFSSLPSTMQKDTAYLYSGLNVVKFGSRSPGFYSPNTVRIPAAVALEC